jgi:endonuclease YncB( thermonuclease family)
VDPPEKTDYIAGEILSALGDESSKAFYRLVAGKIPESFIRKKLSELKQGSARLPTRVFVSSKKNYAAEKLSEQKCRAFTRINKVYSGHKATIHG